MTYYCKGAHVTGDEYLDISVCADIPLIGLPGHVNIQSQVLGLEVC